MTDFAAVLLAGGRGSRMGGVHKPALVVAGSTLLDRCVQAVADASPVVVVGPATATARPVLWTREDPPGGGPVAGLAAGLALIGDASTVAVLATDLAGVTANTVARLRAAVRADGAVLDDGHTQWLIGVWRADSLRRVLLKDPAGASLRSVLGALDYAPVTAEPGETVDVDTPADLAKVASQHPHR
ncbi:molybdenum cofactor guanylyltransferase [Kutzneria kofuensis]|uniref:Molybdopterin-guanine dinucleotide biosynthesis protein A n=1 Tax=Kutzneria kofuensis TaxID=103725 RepID=A0A7W9KBH5_9PSEU|nr:NTP transferase domain-containing protein [Kutzneria kofuensis]MBB5889390.1 molybdopterin-guanine dinucleotide biosynthesis protein A [Kutzneria kofuensis]